VGRLVEYLKKIGKFDNTIIIFLSDNGACAEGGEMGGGNDSDVNLKDAPLFTTIGQAWANASNTPFRRYKHYVHEGGISTPLIIHWPNGITKRSQMIHSPSYLIDIMPTVLEVSGAEYPEVYKGNAIFPIEGQSVLPLLREGEWQEHKIMFWEHESNCSLRMGRYKVIQKYDTGNWELYDLEDDRSELNDLSESMPGLLRSMTETWYGIAREKHVIPKPDSWKF
jgi:arylsulfatase